MSADDGNNRRSGRRVQRLRSLPAAGESAQSTVHVGQRLRDIRVRRNLTQEQAAHRAGLTRNTLVGLERKRFPDPHLSTLLGLMHAYELGTVEELLGPLPSVRIANAWDSPHWGSARRRSAPDH